MNIFDNKAIQDLMIVALLELLDRLMITAYEVGVKTAYRAGLDH